MVSPPVFVLAPTIGGSAGVVIAQLGITMNAVTSADQALGNAGTPAANQAGVGPVHPVVFLNSITPGNYGFVQESGVATVITSTSTTQAYAQFAIVQNATTTANGTMTSSSATFGPFAIGTVIDPLAGSPPGNTPFKILLNGPVVQD